MKDRIARLRKKMNLRQREFAEKVGVSTGTVGSWESGVNLPGEARIRVICNVFNVRREWLEYGEGEMFEPEKDESENFLDVMMGMYRQLDDNNKKLWGVLAGKIIEAGDDVEKATKACMETLANKSAVISNVGGDVTVNQ